MRPTNKGFSILSTHESLIYQETNDANDGHNTLTNTDRFTNRVSEAISDQENVLEVEEYTTFK